MRERISRKESSALTRQRLLEAANRLFRSNGFLATSIEAISESAGYSKGAFYGNFDGKGDIFLTVFRDEGSVDLEMLIGKIDNSAGRDEVENLLVDWAHDRSQAGSWALAVLEYSKNTPESSQNLNTLREIVASHWYQLGERVLHHYPAFAADPATFGALLHEIAYAPAMTFSKEPSSTDIMRLFLASLPK